MVVRPANCGSGRRKPPRGSTAPDATRTSRRPGCPAADEDQRPARTQQMQPQIDRVGMPDTVEHRVHLAQGWACGSSGAQHSPAVGVGECLHCGRPSRKDPVGPGSERLLAAELPGLTIKMSRSGCSIRSAAVTNSPMVPGPITTTRSPARSTAALRGADRRGFGQDRRRDDRSPMRKQWDSCATSSCPTPPTTSENPMAGATRHDSRLVEPFAQVRLIGGAPGALGRGLTAHPITGSTTTRSPSARVVTPGRSRSPPPRSRGRDHRSD